MLQVNNSLDPLLKRPFSIFEYMDRTLKFLYRIRGKGTLSLANLRVNDIISAIGPLGNSYPEPQDDFISVAGGIGIASILPLLRKFKRKAYLFYGAKNKEELVMIEEARHLSKEIFITTDDGSEGRKGLITETLSNFLDQSYSAYCSLPIYACGPTPMIKELSSICMNKGLRCYASFEEHMACGVGACLGCVVETTWGYKRVCREGPVFDVKEVVWSSGVEKKK